MTNLTDADLTAMKARADAATPGPWEVRDCSPAHPELTALFADESVHGSTFDMLTAWSPGFATDADFIAHAREDVPALLVEVAALRKQIDVADKAPHEDECRTRLPANWANRKCDCWKAEYDAAKEALDHE